MRPGHLALRERTLWRYREVLPIEDAADRISLGEASRRCSRRSISASGWAFLTSS